MEKGKQVLCEKPLAMSEIEVKEMTKTSEIYGVLLMEAFMCRYTPRMKKILEIVSSGLLGIDPSHRLLVPVLSGPTQFHQDEEDAGRRSPL